MLTGTWMILVLAYFVRKIPFSVKTTSSIVLYYGLWPMDHDDGSDLSIYRKRRFWACLGLRHGFNHFRHHSAVYPESGPREGADDSFIVLISPYGSLAIGNAKNTPAHDPFLPLWGRVKIEGESVRTFILEKGRGHLFKRIAQFRFE